MPVIWIPVRIKGRSGEMEVVAAANSKSDLVVLTQHLALEIDPQPLNQKVKVRTVTGQELELDLYRIQVGIADRNAEVDAVIIPGRDSVLLGHDAMAKLGIALSFKRASYFLE